MFAALRAQNATKDVTSQRLMGCTIDRAIQHIEAQFTAGMTWDNWAHDTWHVDHIRPCQSFDLTDKRQLKACFFFANLQPLPAFDNLSKNEKTAWTPADGGRDGPR